MSETYAVRLASYERRSEWPLLVLALAMVPLLVMPVLVELSSGAERAFFSADAVIWAVFAGDLSYRTYLAERRVAYLLRNWLDVLIVVVPFLRPLRALRVIRALRLAILLARSGATARSILRRHGLDYVLGAVVLLVLGGAVAVTVAERETGGAVDDFPTALWWAIVTVTTVGYGDVVPDSVVGRVVGVALMLVGIGLFGALTANVAAYFVRTEDEVTNAELMAEIRSLRAAVDR